MEISALVSSASNSVCLQTELSPRCFGQNSVFCLCSSQPPSPLLICFPARLNSPLLPRHVSSHHLARAIPPTCTFTFHLPHQNPACLSESCLHALSSKKVDHVLWIPPTGGAPRCLHGSAPVGVSSMPVSY